MIGVDTNLLVRYLLKDDAMQWASVDALFRSAVDTGERLFINNVVLCELAWVLESRYGWKGEAIADAVDQILSVAEFEFEQPQELLQAVRDCRLKRAGFADALIGRVNRSRGADHTVTFDRDLKLLDTFKVL